jgi:hypothetical protein
MIAYVPDFVLNFTVKRVVYIIIGMLSNKERFQTFFDKINKPHNFQFFDRLKTILREFTDMPPLSTEEGANIEQTKLDECKAKM